jgi:DNA-binding SARP family transcriptional activator
VRFLIKITGYSRQQITRLIKQYGDTGKIERQQRIYQGFETRLRQIELAIAPLSNFHPLQYTNNVRHKLSANSLRTFTLSKNQHINSQTRSAPKAV